MRTVKRLTTLPERSVNMPCAVSGPLKYWRRSSCGCSLA
jgi:hypothetical protein